MDGRRWSDLPADVLREISVRVCAPAGFVYFHAVCKPWRASRDPLARRTTTSQFLPWLLAPADADSTELRFRCIFSKSSYHAMSSVRPPAAAPSRNWVYSADGTKVWYLIVESLRPSLHDPLTGEVTHLPLFPDHISRWVEENPRGVIYGDGTTFLYSICYVGNNGYTARFRAAFLRPGRDEWTIIERTLTVPRCHEFCAAYHRGKIMVTVEVNEWRVLTPPDGGDSVADVIVPITGSWRERDYYSRRYSYLVESRGELLYASVYVHIYYHSNWQGRGERKEHVLSMSVHTLEVEEEASTREKMKVRWVRKDGRSLADRVLFLGTPNSFVVDASRLGGQDGGCAYLVYRNSEALPCDQVGVFRFNLVSNKVEFVERLPRGWNDGCCTWHVPQQPAIAPIQELMKARELKQHGLRQTPLLASPARTLQIERHYEPCFGVMVHNLPLTLESSQLQLFLSKHGKVSSAEVLSHGVGLVTISTLHAHQEDALDALNELSFDGCNLEVILVK